LNRSRGTEPRQLIGLVSDPYRHLLYSHGYADDTQLYYVSFRPDCGANQESTLSALEECISDVRAWLVSHKLMLKDSKTEFLVIGTPLKLDP
jgi:hypothetical protein